MAKKSTCLYIITKSVWGGAARYVYDLAVNLADEFETSVAAGGQGRFAQRIQQANLPYYQIKNFQRSVNPFKDFFAFFEILKLLFRLRPEIVHVNSSKAGGLVGLAGWLYKTLRRFDLRNGNPRLRLIFTAHGWAFNEDRPSWQIWLIKIFSRLTSLFYDKVICVSEYDCRIAIENKIAPADKLATIHNGIDIEAIFFLSRQQAQKKLLGKTSPLVIGTIAEWTKNKGLFYFLEAIKGRASDVEPFAKGFTSEARPFDVILIGSGENPDREEMYRLAKKHKNIHLIEFIDNAASYLKAFDIFVLSSLKEGLPYTILEAMAAQVPVIATDVGGVPEMIENCGILIPPKNSQELADKIKYLINNPQAGQEMAERARQKAVKEFSLEKMLRETKKLY